MMILDSYGAIVGVLDSATDRALFGGREVSRPSIIKQAKDAWSYGSRVFSAIPVSDPQLIPDRVKVYPDNVEVPADFRGRAFLTYSASPYGYKSYGNGNSVDIVLNVHDGKVVRLFINSGWTYIKPDIRIDRTAAAQAARKAVRSVTRDTEPQGILLQYVTPGGAGAPPRAKQLLADRKVPLCYVVRFKSATVLIDSTSGESLGVLVRN